MLGKQNTLSRGLWVVALVTLLVRCQHHDALYTNGFLVEFDQECQDDVADIAAQHGFTVDDLIEGLGLYHLVHNHTSTRNRRSLPHLTEDLLSDTRVISAVQQRVLLRDKREIIHGKSFNYAARATVNKSLYRRVNVDQRRLVQKDGLPRMDHMNFRDPYYVDEWYIANEGQTGGRPGVDMNVVKAWKAGYTGKGVVVCILDDGIDYTHPDLAQNYDAYASIDLNDKHNTPYPRVEDPANSHGTKCAGEVAAVANNSVCGVGVAYEARIAGIRILDGRVTDHLEAKGLLYHCNYTHIFSASWGPKDNGRTMEAPLKAARLALENGVKYGRNGLGTIYVWATGNGGLTEDDCNCDGYVSSIETLSIGSITDRGERPYFMELCPSTMVVVPTGGASRLTDIQMETSPTIKVVTTDLHHDCTLEFQGTSSAAPMGAGCIALTLQANPRLTWRDVQHIVVHSARIPGVSGTWTINGAGLHLSDYFGFGVMDCAAMVWRAQTWRNVPPQRTCIVERRGVHRKLTSGHTESFTLTSDACAGSRDRVDQLEHVQLSMRVTHDRRGDVQIFLTSPQGTRSEMLSPRPNDQSDKGFNFTFMTVRSWGESARGVWLLEVHDCGDKNGRRNKGEVLDLSLILRGHEGSEGLDTMRKAHDLTRAQASDLMEFEQRKAQLLVVPHVNETRPAEAVRAAAHVDHDAESTTFQHVGEEWIRVRPEKVDEGPRWNVRDKIVGDGSYVGSLSHGSDVEGEDLTEVWRVNHADSGRVSSKKRTFDENSPQSRTGVPARRKSNIYRKYTKIRESGGFNQKAGEDSGDQKDRTSPTVDSSETGYVRNISIVDKIVALMNLYRKLYVATPPPRGSSHVNNTLVRLLDLLRTPKHRANTSDLYGALDRVMSMMDT